MLSDFMLTKCKAAFDYYSVFIVLSIKATIVLDLEEKKMYISGSLL